MTNKQLQVTVKMVDQASATMRGIVSRTVGGLRTMLSVAADTSLAVTGVVRAAQTLQRVIVDNEAANELDKIGKASRRLGVSTEFLSKLSYTAGLADVEFESLAKASSKLNQNLGLMSLRINRTGEQAFDRLRISARDAFGQMRSIDELLPSIADGLRNLPSGERTATVRQLFGREGDAIINVLEGGRQGLTESFAEAQRLGVVYSREATEAAEEYNDAVFRIGRAWLGVKAAIVTEVAPALTDFLNRAAFSVGRLSGSVGGIASAIRKSVGEGEDGILARQGLANLVTASYDLLKTATTSLAKTFVEVVIQGLNAGFESIAPRIGDVIQDALSQIPLLGIEPSMRRQAVLAREELDRLGVKLPDRWGFASNRRAGDYSPQFGVGTPVSESLSAVTGRLGTPSIEYENKLKEVMRLDQAVLQQQTERSKAFQAVLAGSVKSIEATAQQQMSTVEGSMDRFFEIVDSFRKRTDESAFFDEEDLSLGRQGFEKFAMGVRGYLIPALATASNWLNVIRDQVATTELNERFLSATGRGREADRLRLVREQDSETVQAAKDGRGDRYLQRLREIQRLELARYDTELAAKDTLDALTKARERYSDAVARNAELVEAGTLRQAEATRENLQAADSLRALGEQAQSQISTIITANPALAEFLQKYRDDVERILGEIPTPKATGSFKSGFYEGLDAIVDDARDLRAQGRQSVDLVRDIGIDRLSASLADAATGVKSLKDAFREWGQSALRDVAQLTTRLLLLRAVGGILGNSGFGTPTASVAQASQVSGSFAGVGFGVNTGGLITRSGVARFAAGGYVAGPNINRDVVPAMLTPGEFVLNRRAVAAAGVDRLHAMNRGGGGSGVSITVNVQSSPGTTDTQASRHGRIAAASIVEELERNPSLRSRWRGLGL